MQVGVFFVPFFKQNVPVQLLRKERMIYMARGTRKKTTHIKRANGTGSVVLLSGKRRTPYAAQIVVRKEFDELTNKIRVIKQYIGYYSSYDDAAQALDDYYKNPYDVTASKITFSEVYELWTSSGKFDKLSDSSKSSYRTAYKYCETVYNTPMSNIRTITIQGIVDSCQKTSSTKELIKALFSQLFNYAMANDWVNKNYAAFVEIEESEPIYERTVFNKADINYLWEHSADDSCKVILILLYSGLRVNELLKNTIDNVNLDERWIYVPKELAKNSSSIRYVPIHDKIYPFVYDFVTRTKNNNSIITKASGTKVTYNNFVARELVKLNENLSEKHRLHDTRHTFISKAKECNLDIIYTKKIVGHAAPDITTNVYTHIQNKTLLREINKLQY